MVLLNFKHGLPITDDYELFIPELWRNILSCFYDLQAVQLDFMFGSPQINWLVREHMKWLPGTQTWINATKEKCLGMLVYLQEYRVPCTQLTDLVQYCVNECDLKMLLFYTSKDFLFYDNNGEIIDNIKTPYIDRALKYNIQVVHYVMNRFPNNEIKIIKTNKVLIWLIKYNKLLVLQLIIPKLMKITKYEIFIEGIRKNSYKSIEYCLKHLDFTCLKHIVPTELLSEAAQYGHLQFLKLMLQINSNFGVNYIPEDVFFRAFSYGQYTVCKYIKSKGNYAPGTSQLMDICKRGYDTMLDFVDITHKINDESYLRAAIRSKNSKMVRALKNIMPTFKFRPTLLTAAAHTRDSDMLITVFDCGLYSKLPKQIPELIVKYQMYKALTWFFTLKLFNYTESMLLEACRICDDTIINSIIQSEAFLLDDDLVKKCMSRILVAMVNDDLKMKCREFFV